MIKKYFIDLGAYQGDSLEIAIKNFKDVDYFYAFEPLVKNYQILKNIFRNNNKILIYNLAADINDKDKKLYLGNKYGCQGNSLFANKVNCHPDKYENISTINFPEFIKSKFNKRDYIILKIDIEGKEYDLLEQMLIDGSIEYIDNIFCEWHYDKIDIPLKRHNNLIKNLKNLNFNITGKNKDDEFIHKFL